MDGRKELLDLYMNGSEDTRFWLGVLSELQQRGVRDILMASIDNSTKFTEAAETVILIALR